jgi:hypothetical protein
MVAGSFFAFADPALRYQRASGRVERRGERSENRIERRDERGSGRIENRQERSGERIERRDERISNRIERRDMLFSLPAEAMAVTVGGTRCYKVGGLIYRPAFYQGETVYVLVPE